MQKKYHIKYVITQLKTIEPVQSSQTTIINNLHKALYIETGTIKYKIKGTLMQI